MAHPPDTSLNASASGLRVILVRHGQTEWNRLGIFQGRSDIPLNAQGKAEARALADSLRHEPIAAIYSSPLTRARQTARIIQRFHPRVSLVEDGGLVEMDLGDFEGINAADWARRFPEFREVWQKRPSSLRMPGGEGLPEVQRRVIDTLNRIAQGHRPGETVVVCSHNFAITGIRCHALGIDLDEFRTVKQGTGRSHVLYRVGGQWVERP